MGFGDASSSPALHLVLGLATTTTSPPSKPDHNTKQAKSSSCNDFTTLTSCEPSLTLALSAETYTIQVPKKVLKKSSCEDHNLAFSRQASPPHSAVSSFSGGGRVVKRERDEEVEVAERVSSRGSDEDEDGINARKKLRLTKQQSALLEESFKENSTLNPKQKQALARELNLRPRQVEVWFQNRRARTKLKQTEVDCELLKKCCETLSDENRRLQKEVQELKAMKLAAHQPLYMAATLTMCPSCERIASGDDTSKHHFYLPFPNPSAAC